jgi:saccharopine dehydrogenase-like NADP-dependent oxidoreductase
MKVGIIGAGKIGETIYSLLQSQFNGIEIADAHPKPSIPECQILDVLDPHELQTFIYGKSAIINAGPYFLNKTIAHACALLGVAYFDLSEDIESARYIKELSLKYESFFMPHCGLAPGAINIIASGIASKFDTIRDMHLRVGALPLYPNNHMKYYLSWSTDGLINEYINPGEAIIDGKLIQVQPLEGLEPITIDGIEYEAFSTSGGAGTLCHTFSGKVQNLSYKTIRYPGHHHLMKFLFDDLNFRNNKPLLTQIFNQEIPQTKEDIIIVYVNVTGTIKGNLVQKTYVKKIAGMDEFSAIQLSTASGACAALSMFLGDKLPQKGFVNQEEISLDDFLANPYGSLYQN